VVLAGDLVSEGIMLVTPGVANEKAGLTRTRGRKRQWQARGTNALDFLRKV